MRFFSPQIARELIGCYRSQCQTKSCKGLPTREFFKFVATSNGRKSPKEVERLVRFVKIKH